ncbi:hypothetical protein Hanom_Chr10g00930761 [Helianthus anomalus]
MWIVFVPPQIHTLTKLVILLLGGPQLVTKFRSNYLPIYEIFVCELSSNFSSFLLKVIKFHKVHISSCNMFGLAKVTHLEFSCRAQWRSLKISTGGSEVTGSKNSI